MRTFGRDVLDFLGYLVGERLEMAPPPPQLFTPPQARALQGFGSILGPVFDPFEQQARVADLFEKLLHNPELYRAQQEEWETYDYAEPGVRHE